MHRTRAIRSQLIQWKDLEFNLLNDRSPRRGQLINKGAVLPNAPHHWMSGHCHKSQTNEVFGKKLENYIEINDKNCLPLI